MGVPQSALQERVAPFGKKTLPFPDRNFNSLGGCAMLELHLTAIRCISIHHISTPSISDPRRASAILRGYRLPSKLHATIWVAVFLLDSFFPAEYGYSREQAKGSLLDKAMRMPRQAAGLPGVKSAR